jgi:hypothetical protein
MSGDALFDHMHEAPAYPRHPLDIRTIRLPFLYIYIHRPPTRHAHDKAAAGEPPRPPLLASHRRAGSIESLNSNSPESLNSYFETQPNCKHLLASHWRVEGEPPAAHGWPVGSLDAPYSGHPDAPYSGLPTTAIYRHWRVGGEPSTATGE